jgi:hypothetical protein
MKAVFMNRIDVSERAKRRHYREMEFVWRPYNDYSGRDTELLGHVLWHHYSPPEFFKIKNHEDKLVTVELETDE